MSDLHELVFKWPYNANEVIVTGTFDGWTRSVHMEKGLKGFIATVYVPWEQKVLYKFVVDGKWATIDQAPTEPDWRGNVNNVYNAPPKPKDDTPRYEPPAAQEPKIAPVPAPVPAQKSKQVPTPAPQPTKQHSVEIPAKPKDESIKGKPLDKKDPSPPVQEKVTSSVPGVTLPPVVPVNDTKPVDTPPAPSKPPVNILPTPANLKAPLPIIPVNDASTVDKRPSTDDSLKHADTPSTHTPPINSPRKASNGTTSSNTLTTEKKEEKTEVKPEPVKQPNGSGNGTVHREEPARQPPSTPVKAKTPTIPATPTTPTMLPSPPTTPRKSLFRSTSSSPTSSPGGTISRKSSFKKKRESIITKIKHFLTPEKDKEHNKEKSHG